MLLNFFSLPRGLWENKLEYQFRESYFSLVYYFRLRLKLTLEEHLQLPANSASFYPCPQILDQDEKRSSLFSLRKAKKRFNDIFYQFFSFS